MYRNGAFPVNIHVVTVEKEGEDQRELKTKDKLFITFESKKDKQEDQLKFKHVTNHSVAVFTFSTEEIDRLIQLVTATRSCCSDN